MEVVEIYPKALWSVKYAGDDDDIFSIRMLQWGDVEFLDKFFNDHKQFISNNPFWQQFSIQDVIVSVRKERTGLLGRLRSLCENLLQGKHPNISDEFVVLSKYSDDSQQRKMYGKRNGNPPSMLRLYAIRLQSDKETDTPIYVITGGGIKLTQRMGQMKELQSELNKMLSVQKWLEVNGIKSKQDLYLTANK